MAGFASASSGPSSWEDTLWSETPDACCRPVFQHLGDKGRRIGNSESSLILRHMSCQALIGNRVPQRRLRPGSNGHIFKWPSRGDALCYCGWFSLRDTDSRCQGPRSSQELTCWGSLVCSDISEVSTNYVRQEGWGLRCWDVLQSGQVSELRRAVGDSVVLEPSAVASEAFFFFFFSWFEFKISGGRAGCAPKWGPGALCSCLWSLCCR